MANLIVGMLGYRSKNEKERILSRARKKIEKS
jgi:hypothetical protein